MHKQIVILRKDLGMSLGKSCSQVSHGSMTFLTHWIRNNADIDGHIDAWVDKDILDNWINGIFTKVILEAKNKNQLLKAKTMAEEMGMKEGIDFFCIYDCCKTEIEPEFIDENGVGRTLTCIGFRPMESEIIDKIGKKFQLYK